MARRSASVSDGYPYDYVDHAARLLSMVQDVLARAVVYARERGGSWDAIAEALNITAEQARDRYTAAVGQWEENAPASFFAQAAKTSSSTA